VSAEIARRALRELGCDLRTREEIVSLVRYHGRPPYLLEKQNPEREVISLSWLVNNRLLYFFALADTRGRRATEMTRPEENLHLWKLLADDQSYLSLLGRTTSPADCDERHLLLRSMSSSGY
jgi:hypothetical protein